MLRYLKKRPTKTTQKRALMRGMQAGKHVKALVICMCIQIERQRLLMFICLMLRLFHEFRQKEACRSFNYALCGPLVDPFLSPGPDFTCSNRWPVVSFLLHLRYSLILHAAHLRLVLPCTKFGARKGPTSTFTSTFCIDQPTNTTISVGR